MDAEKAVLVSITGRVQGVSFRAWAQAEARRLGVTGWVRNERDGSVSALLVGREETVDAMLQRLRAGPPAARVADVLVEDTEPGEPPADFLVTG
jgi:acylphosphatase